MSTVVFLSQSGSEHSRFEAESGATLVDVCDDAHAPVPFSCRGASCGTCRVAVVEGADQLESPADEELDVLDAFNMKAPKFRLACQARLKPSATLVSLRPVRDDE
jgi:ferredoxin